MSSRVTGRSLSPRVNRGRGIAPGLNAEVSGRSVPSQPRCGIRAARYRRAHEMNYHRHQGFCGGVDLHSRTMFIRILDHKGQTVFELDLPANPVTLPKAIKPYRKAPVDGVECMFAGYWLRKRKTGWGTEKKYG